MKELLVNDQIRSNTVLLIGSKGEKWQFTRLAAIQKAREEGMDLVQVAPGAPPVCKIMDYGKVRYERAKAEKKTQHQPQQKETWFHIDTAQHDIDIKMKKVVEWLKKGHKVRFVVKLDGRERRSQNHRQMAKDMLQRFIDANKAVCAGGRPIEGEKEISVVLAPLS
jgi:translation initiation factor IF-3